MRVGRLTSASPGQQRLRPTGEGVDNPLHNYAGQSQMDDPVRVEIGPGVRYADCESWSLSPEMQCWSVDSVN